MPEVARFGMYEVELLSYSQFSATLLISGELKQSKVSPVARTIRTPSIFVAVWCAMFATSCELNEIDPGGFAVNPPRDLRRACQPVHSSLSLGCAGQPVDDFEDYIVIRDDWLWSRSLSLATAQNASEREQLRYVCQ